MRLIGDIGGTNVRFGTVGFDGKVSDIKKYKKVSFKNITEAINAYKVETSQSFNEAVIAVNTVIIKNQPNINSANYWGYNSKTIEKDTRLEKITYLNDLQAHAMAIPYLEKSNFEKIYGETPENKGPIVVIGPGTGLGVSFGFYNETTEKYDFHAGEVGQQFVAVSDLKQVAIIEKMQKTIGTVRWDELTSGRGISNLFETFYGEKKSTEEIMEELYQGSEKSEEVYNVFCEFLGVLVRNVATTFLATGGMFLIGGILERDENLELLKKSKFRDYYNLTLAEGRTTHIKDYPIYRINCKNPSFVGLANY